MTPFEKKALTFLQNAQPATALQVAEYLWPDSPSHKHWSFAGTGAGNGIAPVPRKGVGAWLCAGRYMAKLCKKGWVDFDIGPSGGRLYRLSPEGRSALEAAKKGRVGE